MTELIWAGKYDSNGQKSSPLRVALPFQTIETVNESAGDRDRTRSLFAEGRELEWRNRLIWGDKKWVLPSLLPELAGSVNLIYIDPPFDTGADFSFTTTIPGTGESFTKEPSVIEQKAYRDTWGRGLASYLQWFYETVLHLHELLHETGSIYVHLDWHVGHYAKAVLDEVFGRDNFQNEIIWKRTSARSDAHTYNHIHDVIFFYSKSQNFCFNLEHTPYDQAYVDSAYRSVEEKTGRRYTLSDLMAAGTRRGSSGQPWRGINPKERGNHWKFTTEKLDELDTAGRIYWPAKEGGVPRYKRYLDEMPGIPLQSIWTDIGPVPSQGTQAVGYNTQKPEALLERIIKASSNEGDLVLDCFCGSGTTAAVAEKLQRRWVTCDLGRFAIHTARKRLLGVPHVKPFVVQNLGKYERQAWQSNEFDEASDAPQVLAAQKQRAYIEFILKLYHARPMTGHAWLHGVKNGRFVHVGAVDAPVSTGDVRSIAIEFKRATGSASTSRTSSTAESAPTTNGVDVLGWEFAFEMNETAKQTAAQAGIAMRFLRVPRDVMDKRAVAQGDIKFFELAALSVEAQPEPNRRVSLRLSDFVIPPDDVPADVMAAVKHWEQWIDYWAVDWDNSGASDTFHNQWQTYRTRENKSLHKQASHQYEEAGEYRIVVKVIDILGNDTTKTVTVVVE